MVNNFLLFVLFYFSVIFIAILGLFWNDMRFFGLAVINFFVLSAFLLIFSLSKKKEIHRAEPTEEDISIHEKKETKVAHQQFVKYPYMKQTKKSHKFFRWIFSKFHLIGLSILGLLLVWAGFELWQKYDFGSQVSSIITTLFEKENQDPYLYESTGAIVGNGIITGTNQNDVVEESGMVLQTQVNTIFLGETSSGSEVASGTIPKTSGASNAPGEESLGDTLKKKLGISDTSSITLIDALVYLMDLNKVPLSSKTNVRFTYVTAKNPYYAYYVTAYQKQIIGGSTNPSTKITCDTYQVFKGMIEGWNLKYSSANVKSVFWAEAQKRNVLNGCVKGKLVKGENL